MSFDMDQKEEFIKQDCAKKADGSLETEFLIKPFDLAIYDDFSSDATAALRDGVLDCMSGVYIHFSSPELKYRCVLLRYNSC